VEKCKCGTNAEAKKESKERSLAQARTMSTSHTHYCRTMGTATA